MTPNHSIPGVKFYPWLNKPMTALRLAAIKANLRGRP
jgi:hypothetical protein